MKRPAQLRPAFNGCVYCTRPNCLVMCARCSRSYDSAMAKDRSIMAALLWAAQRARRFARQQLHAQHLRRLARFDATHLVVDKRLLEQPPDDPQ